MFWNPPLLLYVFFLCAYFNITWIVTLPNIGEEKRRREKRRALFFLFLFERVNKKGFRSGCGELIVGIWREKRETKGFWNSWGDE